MLFLRPQLVVKTKYIDTLIELLLYFTYFTQASNRVVSSVFQASVLLLIMNFDVILSK